MNRLFIVLLTLLFPYSLATGYPYSLTDDLGREVLLVEEPMRIISMMPSHTETVCALGACEKLVGRDQFSNYPEVALDVPSVGSGFSPDIEAIVALEPDLVLIDESSELADTLSDLGLTVYAGTAQSYDEVFEKLSVIGSLVNKQTEAAMLAGRLKGEVDSIAELTKDQDKPLVYYELDPTPFSVGPESFIGVLLSKAGADNIVSADLGEFPQLDPEYIVAADPDIIMLGDAPYGESKASLAARPGWESLRALQTANVFELDSALVDAISRPGPRIAEAVRQIAQLLHPDLLD